MKTGAFILAFLFVIGLTFAQEETTYKEYSYTELFEMIEAETDSVFELEDVVIAFNPQTDSLYTIEAPNGFRYNTEVGNSDRKVITKELRFSNVNFRDETININENESSAAI